MWPGLFALLGIVLLLLAAFGVTAGRVSLALLGAAYIAGCRDVAVPDADRGLTWRTQSTGP